MAKFKGKDLYLNSDDQVYFGDNAEAAMWYDASGKLQINHTVSGVAAVQPYDLVILSQLTDAIGGVTEAAEACTDRITPTPKVMVKVALIVLLSLINFLSLLV